MWLRGEDVVAALGVLALVPAAGFGRRGPRRRRPGSRADAGNARPEVPRQTRFRLSFRCLRTPHGMGMGGRDCESERSPGIGV